MLQIDRAWEYLQQEEDSNESFVHYATEVQGPEGEPAQRGIYIRENANTNGSRVFTVHVHSDADKVKVHTYIVAATVLQ